MEAKDKLFLIDLLKRSGLKVTTQRLAILKHLIGNKSHPTAEMIYKHVRKTIHNVSFNTVYTTLLKFSEYNILKTVEGNGGSKRFDPDTGEHGHFICLKCGKIEDFDYKGDITRMIPDSFLKNAVSKRILIEGYCKICSGKT